jgi:hypothetical protein
VINIIEKFLFKRIFNLEKFVNFICEFLEVMKKHENKNDKMRILCGSIITYFLNRISQLCDSTYNNNIDSKDKFNEIITLIKDKIKNFSCCKSMNMNTSPLIKEVQIINDNLKKPNSKDYLVSFDHLTSYIIELINLEKILKADPNFFNVENIVIENVEIKTVEKSSDVQDLSQNYQEGQILDENKISKNNLDKKVDQNQLAASGNSFSTTSKESIKLPHEQDSDKVQGSTGNKINLEIIYTFSKIIFHTLTPFYPTVKTQFQRKLSY